MGNSLIGKTVASTLQSVFENKKPDQQTLEEKFGDQGESTLKNAAWTLGREKSAEVDTLPKATERSFFEAALNYQKKNFGATINDFKKDFSDGLQAHGVGAEDAKAAIDQFIEIDGKAFNLRDTDAEVGQAVADALHFTDIGSLSGFSPSEAEHTEQKSHEPKVGYVDPEARKDIIEGSIRKI